MARVRMYLWFAAGWSYLVLTYPIIFLAKYFNARGKIELRDSLANIIILRFSRLMFYMTGSRLNITGRENIPKGRAVLFASNHLGHMDSLIIQGFIKNPKGFICIKEYGKTPILRTWMKYMGCVFIDRDDMRQSLISIKQATENLNRGLSMVVFPEGKLNDGKETLEFQRGWLRMVSKNGIPIIPITLKNSHNVIAYNGKGLHSSKVECIISEPIETVGLNKNNEKEFLQHLKDVILEKF